jgi:two-component system nitrate/nitrite response regulator NarL
MVNPIRVAVIDDHPLFREGVTKTLASVRDFEVVGEGATALQALRIAQDHSPDIVLLDVALPGGGVEAAAAIAGACPNVCTVMLTASENEHHLVAALKAGARGYILKGTGGRDLIDALRAVCEGQSYVPPNLAARLLVSQRQRAEAVADYDTRGLTSREKEIFALVARGMSNKEIARAFICTERTVKHHMTNIMQKLNVRNRVQAALKFCPADAAA